MQLAIIIGILLLIAIVMYLAKSRNKEDKRIVGDCIVCYSLNQNQQCELTVQNNTVFYKNIAIGIFKEIENGYISTETNGVEIHFKVGDFITFINSTRNKSLSKSENVLKGGDLVGPTIEINQSYIASVNGEILAEYTGDRVTAVVAFICANANIFSGIYHDYFTLN